MAQWARAHVVPSDPAGGSAGGSTGGSSVVVTGVGASVVVTGGGGSSVVMTGVGASGVVVAAGGPVGAVAPGVGLTVCEDGGAPSIWASRSPPVVGVGVSWVGLAAV